MTSATALKFPVAPGSLELAKREMSQENVQGTAKVSRLSCQRGCAFSKLGFKWVEIEQNTDLVEGKLKPSDRKNGTRATLCCY